MCLTYMVAEVTHCKQAEMEFQGYEEIIYSGLGGLMDYAEDRSRPKRYYNTPPCSLDCDSTHYIHTLIAK